MKKIVLASLLLFSSQAFAEQWICATEHMMGFMHNEKTSEWKPVTFTDKPKYIVSVTNDSGQSKYVVKELGSNNQFAACTYYVSEQDEYFITCQEKHGSSFLFNKSRNRFQFTNVLGGYVYPYLKGRPPYMSIGRCSSF